MPEIVVVVHNNGNRSRLLSLMHSVWYWILFAKEGEENILHKLVQKPLAEQEIKKITTLLLFCLPYIVAEIQVK